MHKTQYDEKRLALTEAGNVDDIYDLLAAHEHKVSTADQVRGAHIGSLWKFYPCTCLQHIHTEFSSACSLQFGAIPRDWSLALRMRG